MILVMENLWLTGPQSGKISCSLGHQDGGSAFLDPLRFPLGEPTRSSQVVLGVLADALSVDQGVFSETYITSSDPSGVAVLPGNQAPLYFTTALIALG